MSKAENKIDPFFLQLTVAILITGIFFVFSASWYESIRYTGSAWTFFVKHAFAVIIGIAVMFASSLFHYKIWQRLVWPIVIATILLLILTNQFGVVSGGSRRWLALGFVQLQTSEFVKIAAVMLLSKAFYEQKRRLISIGLVGLMGFFVLKQPDLGTTLLILSSAIFVSFAARVNLFLLFGSLGALGFLVWQQILATPYQMERVKYWLNPYLDPLGHGYNLIQSQNAIGSGGLWGLGFGASQQKLGVLPISHADFIFSIVAEEIGFLGAVAVLLLFMFWILRALKISFHLEDSFAQILGVGLCGIFALQVIINVSVATGLFPITGMTLPFISFGGSSFVSSCLLAGIMLNLSRYARLRQ